MKKIIKAYGLISGFDGKPMLSKNASAGSLDKYRMNVFAKKAHALAMKYWDVFPIEIHYQWPPKGRIKRLLNK